jgi:hypothetical protein
MIEIRGHIMDSALGAQTENTIRIGPADVFRLPFLR